MLNVGLEPRERRLRADLLTQPRAKPLVEEQRTAADAVAANGDLSLPEFPLERPLLGVRLPCVTALLLQLLEHKVLDQVGRSQRRTSGIQRLEDLLRILVGTQVDNPQLQASVQYVGQGTRPPCQ